MKNDEVIFFAYCYVLRTKYDVSVRAVVNMFEGVIHHKRCWYLLQKWASKFGFYDYGVALDFGWFEDSRMPESYKTIINEMESTVDDSIKEIIKGFEEK